MMSMIEVDDVMNVICLLTTLAASRYFSSRQLLRQNRRLWFGHSKSEVEWFSSVPAANRFNSMDGRDLFLCILSMKIMT